RSHLKLQYREFMMENRFGLLKETVSGEMAILSRGFPYSDQLGVWLGADTLHVYPSLIFNGSYHILPGFSLLLENDPRITAWSRYDHLNNQPFQSLLSSQLQTKIPLNATAMLIYETDLRFALGYTYSSYRDYLSYTEISGIYSLQPVDFEQQKFQLQAGYYRESGNIILEGNYYLPAEDIPFLPDYQITGGISLNPGKAGIDIQAEYSSGAETQVGDKMDPIISLQARCRYQLFRNLDLIVEGFNLLDRENTPLPLLPTEPLRLGAGFIWKF
ncbi:MAG: hypothetical protein JW784_02010, partial [Candidatus Cloacimonetes bacterium]|nr:hypothetical protein [Candidatus Cloacimonadota bacterium]